MSDNFVAKERTMNRALTLCYAVCGIFLLGAPVGAQVYPLPLVGGDIIPPFVHSFFPGAGMGFDGVDADPQGITNFNGLTAMGYTAGTATDNSGNPYDIGTDIRVYQGDYVGAVLGPIGFASKSAKAHGTFCEI